MTSQQLLKFLAFVSFAATVAALLIWRETGEKPEPWIIRFAIAAFSASLVVFVIGEDTRPRLMLRFLAAVFATLGMIAFAADFSSSTASHAGFAATSFLERLNDLAPSVLGGLKSAVTKSLGPSAWEPGLTTILGLPTYILFAILAGICGFAGRPRRRVHIYVN